MVYKVIIMPPEKRRLEQHTEKESAFRIIIDKMNLVEKSVQENGYFSEEEVKEELDKI